MRKLKGVPEKQGQIHEILSSQGELNGDPFSALWSQSLHSKTVFPRSYHILCVLCDKDHAEWFISIRSLNFDDNPKHWTCDSIVLHGCGDPGIGSECTVEGHMDRRCLSQYSVAIKLTLGCGDNYWIVPSVRSTEAMFGWICPDLTSSLKKTLYN